MNNRETVSTGTNDPTGDNTKGKRDGNSGGCCDIDIRIDCHGDVNIYNCAAPSGTGTTTPSGCESCFPSVGACLPAVPGAKHTYRYNHVA